MTKEEFLALIDKYLNGEASAEEEDLIAHFFNAQETNHEIPLQEELSAEMWAGVRARLFPEQPNPARTKPRHHIGIKMLIAASLLLMISTLGWYGYREGLFSGKPAEVQWTTLTAGRGQKTVITLKDGTIVHLNSASTISYPEVFAPQERVLRLTGEAYFDVAPDAKRPFIIYTGNITTRVLGTSFNIQAFPEENISITVTTGKVRVTAQPAAANTQAAEVVLTPSQQAIYNLQQNSITTAEVDLQQFVAWKESTLKFKDTSLDQVAITLERWYDVNIVFDSEDIKRCRINGQYQDQSLYSVLKSVQFMYNIDYRFIDQNHVMFYGKGCK